MSEKPHKYYTSETVFGFAQNATKDSVLNGKNLTDENIYDLCSNFLTNRIYADIIESSKTFEQGREESFEIAAQVVVNHGEQIKKQLDENNLEQPDATDTTQSLSNQQSQPNTSNDIKKISGGTMAHIIRKIAEIMATMSPEEQNLLAQNVSAFFTVVGKSFDKTAPMMKELATNVVVVANLKNVLKGTNGENVLNDLVEEHLNENQKETLSNISSEDLEKFKKETIQRQNQTGLSLS